MQYLLARDGKQLGQFSQEEIRSGLFEGRYLPTDSVWSEGMPEWKPLGEVMGQGVTRVAGPRQLADGTFTGSGPPTNTAGLAIAALVLGILGFFTCGITAIPAIVCGHIALSNIAKAGGGLGGRGMAITGLVMGYANLVVGFIALAASLAVPMVAKMGEKGQVIRGINDARQTMLAVRTYAADKEGKYPADLNELVAKGTLQQDVLDRLESFKPSGWTGDPGFEYRGASMTDSSDGSAVVLISRCQDAKGKRVVVTNDTSVELKSSP